MTLWLSFLALAAGCRDKIRPSYTAADFYDPKSTFVSCWYTVEEQSPATISGFIASVLVAFNNYVDQILPNSDPPPPRVDINRHFTYYISYFCLWTFYWPLPPFSSPRSYWMSPLRAASQQLCSHFCSFDKFTSSIESCSSTCCEIDLSIFSL